MQTFPRIAGLLVVGLLVGACTTDGPDSPTAGEPEPSPARITSGPLTEEDLPAAADLGPSWQPDNSPEDPGHGDDPAADGDQAWLTEREPGELIAGLAPLGCPELGELAPYPLPANAVQGRYLTPSGTYAVALRLHYGSSGDAASLIARMAADAAACQGPAEPPPANSPYRRSYSVTSAGPDGFEVSWTESGAVRSDSIWHVLGIRSGQDVGLMYVEERPGESVELPDPALLLP